MSNKIIIKMNEQEVIIQIKSLKVYWKEVFFKISKEYINCGADGKYDV